MLTHLGRFRQSVRIDEISQVGHQGRTENKHWPNASIPALKQRVCVEIELNRRRLAGIHNFIVAWSTEANLLILQAGPCFCISLFIPGRDKIVAVHTKDEANRLAGREWKHWGIANISFCPTVRKLLL